MINDGDGDLPPVNVIPTLFCVLGSRWVEGTLMGQAR